LIQSKPNGLPSFLRVALISTAALLIILFNLASIIPSEHFEEVFYPLFQFDFIFALIALTFVNVLFDYASVTKALFIMRKIVRFGGVKTISFLLLDFLVTFLIVVLYMFATGLLHAVFVWSGKFLELSGAVLEGGVQLAFFATTFLTFGLTLLYVLAVIVLRFTHGGKMVSSFGSKVRSGISWALPVKTLPVRSIGIVAGLLVFLISLILPLFATT
jgi:hypothetical protein